jgi:hypothetical protein
MKTANKESTAKSVFAQAEQWWYQAGFNEMALVTRFRQHEFNPEDGYREFVDACNSYWESLTRKEKVAIWNTFS